jgi:hypothetical protein
MTSSERIALETEDLLAVQRLLAARTIFVLFFEILKSGTPTAPTAADRLLLSLERGGRASLRSIREAGSNHLQGETSNYLHHCLKSPLPSFG